MSEQFTLCNDCNRPSRCRRLQECMYGPVNLQAWHDANNVLTSAWEARNAQEREPVHPDPIDIAEQIPVHPVIAKLEAAAVEPEMHLTSDYAARKGIPMATGLLDYFPDALADVARLSKIANDKHNPGQPLHWSKEKSNDHRDCMIRHTLDTGKIDTVEGHKILHDTEAAWRSLAQLQITIEELKSRGIAYPPLS